MKKGLVSVVIPAFNGDAYIAEAIESVIAQSYPHWEIIVVDNGSMDKTYDVVSQYKNVKYVFVVAPSVALARNIGASQSESEFIAFLDQDDTWEKNKLKKQVGFLTEHAEDQAVIGLQQIYIERGFDRPNWLKADFLLKPQAGYLPSALMVRRCFFEANNGFDEQYPEASDVEWFFRMNAKNISVSLINEVLLYRRIHNENASNNYQKMYRETLKAIQLSLEIKRQYVAKN